MYEIQSTLGAGGMGEVYLAKDTKLGRSVALKVLPDAFEVDPERIARFEREAKALAALNHPHIAALFGMEQSGGRYFLVMELVEGETLAERLQRGAIPVDEALRIAHQIADGLEAAHEKAIVHRDLKPANIKITPDQKVKVLDFGLAKAMTEEAAPGSRGNLTHSPTLSLMATQAGVILGTAAYMSPEQANGVPADHRSDVFSFGVVFYEMLTGRQPFHGTTAAEILASVLVREPDLTVLPQNLNPRIIDIVKRCLEKNPKRRWQAIGDLRAEIEAAAAAPLLLPATTAIPSQRPFWKRAIPVAAAAVVTGALASAATWALKPSPPLTVTKFAVALGEGQQFTNAGRQVLAISPDGRQMVYVADQKLYLRRMADLDARPIPGTDPTAGVLSPAFSPDGQSIAYWAQGDQTIKRIALSGGAPVTLCTAQIPFGISWDTSGVAFGQRASIMRVPANGGTAETLVTLKTGDGLAYGPQMLSSEAVLFTLATTTTADRWDKSQIVVQSLKSGERKTLVEGGSDGRYVPTGHIVYALAGVLFAVPFDIRRLEVTGGPTPVVEGVRRAAGYATGVAQFSFSGSGSLIYIPGPVSPSAASDDLALIDRNGNVRPLKLPPGQYSGPRVSPDGKRVAFTSNDGREDNVAIYDLAGTTSIRRLTFGGQNTVPVWSHDGLRIAFVSDREGDGALFWQAADGTGQAERLTKPEQGTTHVPYSWSPKGDTLLFGARTGSTVSLWTLSIVDKKATLFDAVKSSAPINAVFSPDGRWIAYNSDEAGRQRVYVQPFPATGAKYQISKDGHHPLWSPDGKELLFVPGVGQFVAVSVTTQGGFAFGNPQPVPRGALSIGNPAIPRNHDITPDGKIVARLPPNATPTGGSVPPVIHVVVNWFEDLRQRVPVR